ncbi:MAG: hypothetical protein M1120_02620 [Patescibacteria group bacterium]|nr:hypothetical protein [Patescibacteria group bacterium]
MVTIPGLNIKIGGRSKETLPGVVQPNTQKTKPEFVILSNGTLGLRRKGVGLTVTHSRGALKG